jgi:hypothetical protein
MTCTPDSGGWCEVCGHALGEVWAVHHRQLRSQGGKDELANLMAVHHKCHNIGTDSIHLNVKKSIDNGWIVPSWADPCATPLRYQSSAIVVLSNDGQTTPVVDT